MPRLIEVYMSQILILFIVMNFLSSYIIVIYGFKKNGIKRRKDVLKRAIIIDAVYIFTSHVFGIIFTLISYIIAEGSGLTSRNGINTLNMLVMILAMGVSVVSYYFLSRYLWQKLYLQKQEIKALELLGVILATPWYFIINIF